MNLRKENPVARADFERLVGKVVLEPEFREIFFADPEEAALQEGIELTSEEIDALKALDMDQAKTIAQDIDETVVRLPWK
jgi:hypothetical protein